MRRILVATDFSPRSDRALRRASLLAGRRGAELLLVHVVDDDQPARLFRAAREAALELLSELCRTLRDADGIRAEPLLLAGEGFQGIVAAARSAEPDLIVLGSHRRQLLHDVFTGTTAERAIRESRWPVLMANGPPVGPYLRLLVAIDLSPAGAAALHAVRALALDRDAMVAVGHVFAAPAQGLLQRAAVTRGQTAAYLREEESRARQAVRAFARATGLEADDLVLRPDTAPAAAAIAAMARDLSADLIVVGTRGRNAAARLFMGSVAQDVLRAAERDVLAVPLPGAAPAAG